MRRPLIIALAVFLANAAAHAEILVGVAGPLSGQFATLGTAMKAGAEAGAAAINAAGGINGEQITVIASDDACDTKRATEIARDFVAKDVRLVVGHYCSGASLAAAAIYNEAGILMLTPAASLPALTEAGFWNVFRLTGRDDAQADLSAARINGASLVIISDGDPAADDLAKRFKQATPTAELVAIKADASDLATAVSSVSTKAPQFVFFATSAANAGQAAAALRAAGVKSQFLGPEALLADAFLSSAGAAADGTLVTFPADPATQPAAKPATAALKQSGSEPNGAALPAYAAVQVFAAAAKAKSVNDSRAMADWLHSGSTNESALGNISFNAKGDLTEQPFIWYRWGSGSYQPETP